MKAPDPAMPWEEDDATSQRAADFFERRCFGQWTGADQAELDAWLAESILHRAAYLRVEGIVAYTKRLVALRPQESGPRIGKILRRRFVLPLLIAASAALIAAIAFPLAAYLMQPPDRAFSTDIGGRTLLKFADGTEIELNTDTAMRSRMTTRERTVWLEKGEAWFHVAHNPANPFTVVAGNHRVSDLGTEFFVRRGAGKMEVGLLKGRAALSTAGTPTTMLAPGDEAIATPVSVSVMRKTPRELADELAWRRGVLVFRNAPLAQVVREFNRYNTTKLVIADPAIENIEITADLETDDYNAFLNIARTVLNLRTDREANRILISRGPLEKAKRTRRVKHDL